MSDKQLHTFWVKAAHSLQAGFTSPGIDAFVVELQEFIQTFEYPLSADNLLILAQLYAIRQALQVQIHTDELKTLVALGRLPEALVLARFQADVNHKFYSLADIYDALYEKGQPDFTLLDELIALAQQIEGIENQITSRDSLSKALAEAGRFDEALQIARSIPKVDHGMGSRSSALFTIATHLRKLSRDRQADEVVAEAQTRYTEVESSWDIIEVLIGRLAEIGGSNQQNELTAILNQIQNKLINLDYPNRDYWLIRVADTLVKAKYNELAESFFSQALAAIHDIENVDGKRQSLVQLIQVLAVGGYFSEAEKMLSELVLQGETTDDRFASIDVLTAQVELLTQQGKFEDARQTAQRIIATWRAPVLNELALFLAKKDERSQAERVLHDIAKAAREKTDWAERAEALTAMAVVWHHAGYARGADFLFNKAAEAVRIERQEWPGRIGRETTRLIKSLAQTRRFTLAREVADSELLVGRAGWRYTESLCDIAIAAGQAGQDVQTLIGQVSHLSASNQPTTLKHLGEVYVAAGNMIEAENAFDKAIAVTRLQMAQSIRHLYHNTFGDLLTALDASGFGVKADDLLEEGIRIALESTDAYWRPRILYRIAIILASKDRHEHAHAIITEADAASEQKIYPERAEALCEIAMSLARLGQQQEAQTTFAQSWESAWNMAIYGIQEREAREDAMCQVVNLMCQVGFIALARTAAFKLERGSRGNALRHLATAMIKNGDYAEAFEIVGTDLSEHFLVREPDRFVKTLADWSIYVDRLRPGLSLSILREATRTMGWIFQDWQEISETLA